VQVLPAYQPAQFAARVHCFRSNPPARSRAASAPAAAQALFNAHGVGEVALGSSTSQLFAAVADAYRRTGGIGPGDEIVVQEACHEANAGPWVRLAEATGATLVWWRVRDGPAAESSLDDLAALLSPRCAAAPRTRSWGHTPALSSLCACVHLGGNVCRERAARCAMGGCCLGRGLAEAIGM